jgi:uncharacterized protein (DUF1015 family)
MARVRPFAAYRYVRPERDISAVTAPPYDVISPEQRERLLAADESNVVALELPEGPLDPTVEHNRYENGAATWDDWRARGVIAQDAEPAIYVLEQRFEHAGHPVRRRAFVAEVGLEPFDAGIVLPHERTLPKALGDRFELIKATGANLSQVFGLFDDASGVTDELFDRATAAEPVSTAVDADGVQSILWAVTDPDFSAGVGRALADKQIFIADGHHRYTTALGYRDFRREQAAAAGESSPDPAYDFVMMALVNMEDPELLVMPTHRAADARGVFDSDAFWNALAENFTIEDVAPAQLSVALDGSHRPVFLVKVRGEETPRLVRVRDDVDLDAAITAARSSAWKHLDVAVLQELVLEPLLDIHPDRPETLDRLSFIKDAQAALDATAHHDVVFILRPTSMAQLRQVAVAGETMPQKSTYFFPKLLSGLVLRSAE